MLTVKNRIRKEIFKNTYLRMCYWIMYCSKCGKKHDTDDKFCIRCGTAREGIKNYRATKKANKIIIKLAISLIIFLIILYFL